MAIIVNKEEKRRAIALASKSLLLEHGIKNITISKIAECAGVGKGTIYEYFRNKEDIVFEIISVFIAEHEKWLHALIREDISTKEKIKRFLSQLYSDADYEKQLSIYREFLAISLTSNVDEMRDFSRACRERFQIILDQIVDEAILMGEIKAESKEMFGMLHTYSLGLVVESKVNEIDAKVHIDQFVETLFTIIEKKDIR
ncbi:TetR/AcrR family transcriptional regulator [Sulfurovum sp. TSL1]|uniref:TetR/AcrR family transcriptional regulator n=1 Tax=Sulfurovum sp. TSL1 TaxID=2826994 RepID=UPI001CC6C0A8|nr:TetR/AcrR family transcriptional regulator [Sulfurovum sp. TSL1]GIT98035.1 TetR family transcriptional regulator [Sulfurovum sp. TSL1]